MKQGISVLMSVYKKEKPEYLKKALESIADQTFLPNEIVLVEDGELTEELYKVIDDFKALTAERIVFVSVKLKQNQQLGRALKAGVEASGCDYIARMDTDDIAVKERLSVQKAYLDEHPEISAVGGNIAEFEAEGVTIREKHMPLTSKELYAYGKYRNPLNHMTVMFRKDDILEAGNYEHFPLLEDYHLWSRLLAKGKQIANIDRILVNARISGEFSKRRGGFKYFKRYAKLRKFQHEIGYTSFLEYFCALGLTAVMTLQPSGLRDFAYRTLRKK